VAEGVACVTSLGGDIDGGVVFLGTAFPDWTWPGRGVACTEGETVGVAVGVVFATVVVADWTGSTLAA